jgi:hypothetical protein
MPDQDKRSKSADSAFDISNVHSSAASNGPTPLVASCIIGPDNPQKGGRAAKSSSGEANAVAAATIAEGT